MEPINPQRFQALVQEAQSTPFSGWDFSWLAGRMHQEEPPWHYPDLVQARLDGAESMLDMGTGGGEFLASLQPLPTETHATEAYPPNLPIAKKRLSPLGITVHPLTDDSALPFADDFFDLVINRHERYDHQEVHRILKPGGVFITQQVGELDNLELNLLLEGDKSHKLINWGLETEVFHLVNTGFHIQRAEKAALRTIFTDIGAVLYYLKAIPWQIEGFNIETHYESLVRLHNYLERHGELITTAHRFLIIAHKEPQ